jgi:DNA-binding protein HU-beta
MRCYPVTTKVNKWSFEPDAIAPLEPTRCVTWTGHGKGTMPSAIEFGLNQDTVSKLENYAFPAFIGVYRKKGPHMQTMEPSIPKIARVKTAPKVDTVTLKHLAMALAKSQSIPKSQANAVLTGMVDQIAKHLKKGKRIRIAGLGILQVRKRPARMGRNPGTGETIKIRASKKIAFRAAKDLKEAV